MAFGPEKLNMLTALVEQSPDDFLRALDHNDDPAMAQVRQLACIEREDRRRRDLVLSPIAGFYGVATRAALWRAAKETRRDLVDFAKAVDMGEDSEPACFDSLCAEIAKGLASEAAPAWSRAAERCRAQGDNTGDILARLELAAVTRRARSRVEEWTRRMTDERVAAVRLAYADATAISPTAGLRFFEMLGVGLDEPWAILRIISAAMHGPTEAYFAGSELSPFAETALADIDQCIDFVRRFDPSDGAASGPPAAAQATRAARGLVEFAAAIRLGQGPWFKVVSRQRQALASVVEGRLREIGPLIDKALPRRTMGKRGAGIDLSSPPDSAVVARAAGLVAFCDALHACADFGGFAAYRTKVCETLEHSLDAYVEEVLDVLRKGEHPEEAANARRYLEAAADLSGLAKGEKAAEIIRRRAVA